MLFANSALRTLRRKDSTEGYLEFVQGLAEAAGVETPTLEELAAFERKRKDKTLSNKEWESATDADAKLDATGQEAHIPEPQRAERDFAGKPEAERVVEANRERVASAAGKCLQKQRTEQVERSMAHMYETGGMRRLYLRGRANIRKRLLVHA